MGHCLPILHITWGTASHTEGFRTPTPLPRCAAPKYTTAGAGVRARFNHINVSVYRTVNNAQYVIKNMICNMGTQKNWDLRIYTVQCISLNAEISLSTNFLEYLL